MLIDYCFDIIVHNKTKPSLFTIHYSLILKRRHYCIAFFILQNIFLLEESCKILPKCFRRNVFDNCITYWFSRCRSMNLSAYYRSCRSYIIIGCEESTEIKQNISNRITKRCSR
jgi:hypothetical protein